MLSRVADSLYWMGRYIERAENIARLLLVTEDFSSETQGLDEDLAQSVWKDLLAVYPAAQMTRRMYCRQSSFDCCSERFLQMLTKTRRATFTGLPSTLRWICFARADERCWLTTSR